MTESYLPHVGYVLFPRTPADLADGVCPACFTALSAAVCGHCGLDLGHPAAAELREASAQVGAALDRRLELIGRIRYETAQRVKQLAQQAQHEVAAAAIAAAAPVVPDAQAPDGTAPDALAAPAAAAVPAPPAVAAPAAPVVGPSASGAAPVVPVASGVPAAAPPVPAAPPKPGITAQAVLLTVGAILLGIAAIAFLVFAFVAFGLLARTLIILGITAAAIIGASLLARRRLPAAAETVAALGVLLVLLDLWAAQALNLAGLGAAPPLLYWGVALLLAAAGFVLWHRLTRLRAPNLVAYAAAAPGAGLLLAGAFPGTLQPETTAYIFFIGLGIGAFVHLLAERLSRTAAAPIPERVIALCLGVLAVALAGLMALSVERQWAAAPVVALVIVGALALAHLLLVARDSTLSTFGYPFAALAGLTLAAAAVPTALRLDSAEFGLIVPLLVATAVALAFETVHRKRPGSRPFATIAAWCAAGVAALSALASAAAALGHTSLTLLSALRGGPWSLSPDAVVAPPSAGALNPILALAATVALATIVWAITGALRARRAPLVVAAGAILLLAVPLLSVLWAVVAGWLALAVIAVVLLIVARRRGSHSAWLLVPAVAGGIALTLSYTLSWAGEHTWQLGTIGAIVVLLAARWSVTVSATRAVLLGLAVLLALIGALATGLWLAPAAPAWVQLPAALAAIVLLALLPGIKPISAAERRAGFWVSAIGGGLAALATVALAGDDIGFWLPEPATGIALAALWLAALAGWMLWGARASLRTEQANASALTPLALLWLLHELARALAVPEPALVLVPAAAGLLAAAGSLGIAVARPVEALRPLRDLGAGIVLLIGLIAGFLTDWMWLALLVIAVAVLLLAVSRDGLFGSTSARRHLGWLALALATAGLWLRLADSSVTALEPYLLPLTGALLVVAVLIARARGASGTAASVALGGALASLLPLGAVAATGEPLRAIVLTAVSAALLAGGALVPASERSRPWLLAAAAAGLAGVLVTAGGRALMLMLGPERATLEPDAWLAVAALLIAGTAFALGRAGRGTLGSVATGLVVLALGLVLVVESAGLVDARLAEGRVLAMVLVFSTVHVIAALVRRIPLTTTVAWIAFAAGTIAAVEGMLFVRVEPFELVLAPLALALLIVGAVRLARSAELRSWPALGPGLALLLVPSLLATFVDAPLWRLVAIGVVAVGLIVLGAVARLQAPLILGAVIVVVHALRTFAPQIAALYEATQWWMWVSVGGALLLWLGITFEKRRRDAKAVAEKIGRLR